MPESPASRPITDRASVLAVHDLVAGHLGRPAVLDGATIAVSAGSRVAVLGANGSGKTTLLRCLSGALAPASGEVLRDGIPVRLDRAGLRAHRQAVQLVLQDPDDQLFSADVRQDVSFGPLNLGLAPAEAAARVDRALAQLSIGHLAARPTHQLSHGERKRVAMAGAMAMAPRVLLLDEPTAGLDPVGVDELLATLEHLHDEGTTIVLTTHDVDLALAWADQAAVLTGGRLVSGDPLDVLGDADLLASARLVLPRAIAVARRIGIRPERTLDDLVRAWSEVPA